MSKKGINKTHGLTHTRIYSEWKNMRNRCKPNHKHSKTYYYRGISVCEEWLNSFENFYEWAINNGYNDNLSLDRIDNDKGYSPSNCHWIPFENQQCNRTNNVYLF